MNQLSGLDASFLHLETPQMPMHVGALHLFELPAEYAGDFAADLRRHVEGRLPLLPALRRKLLWMPLNLANPAWVDAVPDLDAHIVAIKLPRGSGLPALQLQVAKLHPVLLERDRPLWKFHVFTGLANGPGKTKRFGLYTQLHHAAVDGQAAVALANALLDMGPVPRTIELAPRQPKRLQFGMAEMLSGLLANQWQQVGALVGKLPSAAGALSSMARAGAGSVAASAVARLRGDRVPADGEGAVSNLGLAPRTVFNASVSATRSFAGVTLPMAELKALRRAHGATLNDVVLMICSGALRRLFLADPTAMGSLPRKSLVAAVPVSLRAAGDTASNNQASMTLVKLATQVADPAKRLAQLMAATAAMKATLGSVKTLMPTDFPSLGVPWLMRTATALYGRARLADRLPAIANVAISNVPGPAFALYMAGAKMLTNYPTSIVVHGAALNITVQSYDASLDIGLIACAKALPQPQMLALAAHVQEAFDEFRALAPTAPSPAAAAPPKPAARVRAVAPTRRRAAS